MKTIKLTEKDKSEFLKKALCVPSTLKPLRRQAGIDHELRGTRFQIVRDEFDRLLVKAYEAQISGSHLPGGYFLLVRCFDVNPEEYAIPRTILEEKIILKIKDLDGSIEYFEGNNNPEVKKIIQAEKKECREWKNELLNLRN